MRFGTVTHAAIEAWLLAWKGGDLEGRLAAALEAIAASTLHPYDKIRLTALMFAYDERWSSANWEILAVEVQFEYELGGFRIGGKIDAIIRDLDDGRVFTVEHKTTTRDTSPGSEYWEKLTIDCQVSIYHDGASTLGYEIAGCIYDVIAKPQHELLKATPGADQKFTIGKGCRICGGKGDNRGHGTSLVTTDGKCSVCDGSGWKEAPRLYAGQRAEDETEESFALRIGQAINDKPDGYLTREIIVRPEAELVRMRGDLIDWIRIDQMSRLMSDREPPRNDGACFNFHQRCPYLSACKGDADINDETTFPRGSAHPELAAA